MKNKESCRKKISRIWTPLSRNPWNFIHDQNLACGTHLPTFSPALLLFTYLFIFHVWCDEEANQILPSKLPPSFRAGKGLLSSTHIMPITLSDSLMFSSSSHFHFIYNEFLPFHFCRPLYSLETIFTGVHLYALVNTSIRLFPSAETPLLFLSQRNFLAVCI